MASRSQASASTTQTKAQRAKKTSRKASAEKPKVRPLLTRPGARYECFGDGLCCTDLHGLGPVTEKEVRFLEVISPSVVTDPDDGEGFDEPMLRTRHDGACVFRGPAGCELHNALGPEVKPDGCKRFPLGLTATPRGGRITTRHRCSCRTLGTRPEISPEAAEPSLREGNRLKADRRVGPKVEIDEGKNVAFARYESIEADLLDDLERGTDPLLVLDAAPFPALEGTSWKKEADDMIRKGADHTRFGTAIEWFARSLKHLKGLKEPKTVRPLSWGDSFDQAERRARVPGDGDAILRDWLADEVWSLQWTELGSLARARLDLATRYVIAKDIEKRLVAEGRRPDRAAAEAVTIVDLMGDSEWWDDVVEVMVVKDR